MFAAVILGSALLGGCGGPSSVADNSQPGVPDAPAFDHARIPGDEIEPGWITRPFGAWLIEGETFGIVVWGSSSCPDIPDSFEVGSAGQVTINFANDRAGACTDDLAPMTHTFTLPEAAKTHPITVVVTGPGEDQDDVVIFLD